MIHVTVDSRNAQKKAKVIRTGIRTLFGDIGFNSGKMASFFCAQYTLPFGTKGNDWPFTKMSWRINEDVKSAYGTKSDSGWQSKAYSVIKDKKGEPAADKWWRKYKSGGGSQDYEEQFDKMRLGSGGRSAKEPEYLAYRKQNNYQIPKRGDPRHRVIGMTSEASRQNLITKRLKTMGLAKAGWKAGYHALGGKGASVSKLGGNDRKWPSQINVPYKKFGGQSLGIGILTERTNGFRATITNSVRYADEAFSPQGRSLAVDATNRYMRIIYDLRKKHFRSAIFSRSSLPKAA